MVNPAVSMFGRGDDDIAVMQTGQKPQPQRFGLIPDFFIHHVEGPKGEIIAQECVRIVVPGDLKSESIRKVTDKERQMFPHEYEAWKEGAGADVDGTRLDLWLGKDDPRLAHMYYHKLTTVEQVAALSDTGVQALGMGYQELRDQACQYVARQSSNESIMEQNVLLQEQMKAMQEQLNAMSAPPTDDDVSAEGGGSADVENPLTLKQGFNEYSVIATAQVDDEKPDIYFNAVGKGAKEKCEAYIAESS